MEASREDGGKFQDVAAASGPERGSDGLPLVLLALIGGWAYGFGPAGAIWCYSAVQALALLIAASIERLQPKAANA